MSTTDFNTQALNYVETTGKALGVALKIAEAYEQDQKGAGEKIGSAVDLLKKAGLVDEDESKRAEAQLGNHAQTLDILTNVLDHFEGERKDAQAKSASENLGSAVDDPASPRHSGRQKNANYVGKRRGFEDGPTESDRALLSLVDGYGSDDGSGVS